MSLPRLVKAFVALSVLSAGGAIAQTGTPQYGAESPQAVVAGLQKPIASDDIAAAVPFFSPAGQTEVAESAFGGLLIALSFYDPDDQFPGGEAPSKAELEAKRKNYRAALDLARKAVQPYGLDGLIGQPMSAETEGRVKTGVAKADAVLLVRSLVTTFERLAPLLGMQKSNTKKVPFSFGTVTDYRIDGDRATAIAGTETLEFEKVQGRWYITAPAR